MPHQSVNRRVASLELRRRAVMTQAGRVATEAAFGTVGRNASSGYDSRSGGPVP